MNVSSGNMKKILPTFIIAGAAKAGSTSLYSYLKLHEDILMSVEKEPAFFTKNWDKGLCWYYKQFYKFKGEKEVGEATVEYMVDYRTILRIKKVVPEVKFIFILRNPIRRAYSHYWHRVKMGEEKRKFSEVIRGGLDEYPIKYSLYGYHLERFYDNFDESKIYVLFLEDLLNHFSEEMSSLFKFLGVDDISEKITNVQHNAMQLYRNKLINEIFLRIRKLNLKDLLPVSIYNIIHIPYAYIQSLNRKKFVPPPINLDDEMFLKEIFIKDHLVLRKLIKREIPYVL